jgi:hypothetical protein
MNLVTLKKSYSSKLSFILFTLIYFSASIVLMGNPYRPLTIELIYARYILLILAFIILVFIYFRSKGLALFRFSSYFSFYVILIWVLFGLSVLISEVSHQKFPVQGFFFLLIVPFMYFTVMPFMSKIGGHVMHYSLFMANMLYILISYITTPVSELPYLGVMANPNGFGQLSAIAVISGYFIIVTLPEKRILTKLIILAAIILSVISVLISFSRTSFIIIVIISLIITIDFIIKRNLKPFIVFLLVGIVSWFTPIKDMFINGLMEKFSQAYISGSVLNGRMETWLMVIEDSSLFGNDRVYFDQFFEGAHNSIINILGVYGVIPALLLTVFLILTFFLAVKHSIRNNQDPLGIFPLVIIVTFILYSMTEVMFGLVGTGISVAFYHVVGLLLFSKYLISNSNVAKNT